jgi:TatD DNase family protein
MLSELIDTHSHLALLKHSPLSEILDRAKTEGVVKMISVATEENDWESNRAVALAHPNVYYSLGLHPHEASHWEKCEKNLMNYFDATKCVALGEMGLDFFYNHSPKEIQIVAFEAQLLLSQQMNLPVIIHCRDAFEELFASIKKVGLSSRGGVMHCFTGNADQAKRSVELGLMISFSGILTFKNAEPIREAAKVVPRSRLLVETDCPFLAPIPNRGKPNEPSFLPYTAKALAATLGETPEEIFRTTTENAVHFFKLT